MADTGTKRVAGIFNTLGCPLPKAGELAVRSPADGAALLSLATDNAGSIDAKINAAHAAQQQWSRLGRGQRAQLLETLSAAVRQQREHLAELITLEGGKTRKEALAEADGAADIIPRTIKDASLPEFGGMLRTKERLPVGAVGLITSFNFPLVVAGWTLAPALLAGNAVLWKPSEKTPLVALACKAVFNKAMGAYAGLLQLVIGGREAGAALVSHEGVDMVSATGSVAMGKGIRAALANKKNNAVKPILELGGNNGIIISDKVSDAHLEWAVGALLNSFFGTSGQRCTNTRRLILHKKIHDRAVAILKKHVETLIASGAIQNPLAPTPPSPASGGGSGWGDYGYGPLIDADAFRRFEDAKKTVAQDGGTLLFGKRVLAAEFPDAYYVEPALALMPAQTRLMHEEIFAPILFITPYGGGIDEALELLNAPANAGLVGGIYTQSRQEADRFAQAVKAGHGVINPPKGTGTPAFGMGFGGNGDSGEGEILNAADPLRPFTRESHYTRIAQNKDVAMDQD